MKLYPVCYPRSEAPRDILECAKKYEDGFHVLFTRFACFSKELFSELHRAEHDPMEVSNNVTIASEMDKSILSDMELLGRVANRESAAVSERREYFNALKSIYHKLPSHPEDAASDESTLCVGVEREGRILAESMGSLPEGHSLRPNAKRIPYEGGLVVGLDDLTPPESTYSKCVIVDGAIASGATLMAIIHELRSVVSSFHIFSVHGPYEGLRGIVRLGEAVGVEVHITIGHATVGMNSKYYAVDPADGKTLIVGDLGDTISDIEC